MTCCDIVWHCVTLCDIVWNCITLYYIVWHCVTLCDIVQHCMTLCNIVWHCLTLCHDIVWHCLILWLWHFVTLCDIVWHCVIFFLLSLKCCPFLPTWLPPWPSIISSMTLFTLRFFVILIIFQNFVNNKKDFILPFLLAFSRRENRTRFVRIFNTFCIHGSWLYCFHEISSLMIYKIWSTFWLTPNYTMSH